MAPHIFDLSTEVILHIFQYCDPHTLAKLQQTCKIIYKIISANTKYLYDCPLVTNQIKASIQSRSEILLEPLRKLRISHNWKIGRYKRFTVSKTREFFMPWLNLDKDYLWVSQGKDIKEYNRKRMRYPFVISDVFQNDIVRFVKKEDKIICGLRDGHVWLWSVKDRNIILNLPRCHTNDIQSVDLARDIFVTGSLDKSFKIWSLNFQQNIQPLYTENVGDRIWSVGLSPFRKYLAIGSAGLIVPPLHIYDIERYQSLLTLGKDFVIGSGILDIHWENENILFSCGFDTYLRKWDLRVGNFVQKWEDPHDSALYCLASDDLYTIMCGTSHYGRVLLWDQRKIDYVQMYYTVMNVNSPVYSLSFDGCQLFTAMDRCVNCLDFTNHRGKIINHSDLYKNLITISI